MTNLSPLLDFLIAFVYVLAICSTLLSVCYELGSYWLRTRPYYLYKVLDEVLNDNKLNKVNLTELIYNFPQIDFTKKTYNDKPAYISANNFAVSLVHALNNYHILKNTTITTNGVVATNLPKSSFDLFDAAVKNMNASDLKTLLQTFIDSANNDYDKLITNIENWYNSYMDRVTGWFKIRTQKRMLWIAIPVAVIFNLNFFKIGEKLYTDKASTAILVNMVDKWQPNGIDSFATKQQFDSAIQLKKAMLDSLQKANVPMGWSDKAKAEFKEKPLNNIIGWLVMAIAMVMGAPFWYDLLNKLVNMRKAGLKPNSNTAKINN